MVAPVVFFSPRVRQLGPTRAQLTAIFTGLVDEAKAKGTVTRMGCAPMSDMKLSMMQGYATKDPTQTIYVLRGQVYLNTVTAELNRWEKICPVPSSAMGI